MYVIEGLIYGVGIVLTAIVGVLSLFAQAIIAMIH